jgi:hypothetical protein
MTASSTEDSVLYPREVPSVDDGAPYPASRPRIGLWEALRRKWPIVAVTTLAFVAAGLALGLSRAPTYKAQSRLAVGRIDISAAGAISNFAVATESLASQYSRMAGASQIVNRVAREVKMPRAQVANSIAASPIPQSPVFMVEAKSSRAPQAVALAIAASQALVDYTTKLNRSNPDSPRLFKRFQRASLKLNRLREREGRLKGVVGGSPTAANREALAKAQTRSEAASLEAVTERTAYSFSRQSQSATSLVQVLTKPAKASSDRATVLQLYLFIGLAAGVCLGLALALALAQREARRALAG